MFGLVSGYSLATYFLTSIWYNIRLYMIENYIYVISYLLATGGVSFAICYRMVKSIQFK